MENPSRRSFLTQIGVGATLATSLPRLQAAGANERVRWGLIGCGQRGRKFFAGASAVCDPDRERLNEAAAQAGIESRYAVTDLRRVLDDPDIDAVVIATPDHWHAPAAILACQAGKHVYVEKPATHNFRESQLLLAAAQRSGVVAQHGTQQRSNPLTRRAMQMLGDGVIGEVLAAKAWNVQRRDNIGHMQPSAPPPHVDYDMWVGPAEMVPYQQNRFHYLWHWWYNFGTGDVGGDGPHELDYARWGLGVDEHPARVSALGAKYYFDDDQQFPDTATCVYEFPGNGQVGQRRQLTFEMRIWSNNYPHNCDSGVEFYGTKGQLFFSKRGKLEVLGERNRKVEAIQEKKDGDQIIAAHLKNFLDSIRGEASPNASLLEAHRTVALVHLANISIRTGRTLNFDPQTEQIVDDPQASQLLTRNYRNEGHWAIPKGV